MVCSASSNLFKLWLTEKQRNNFQSDFFLFFLWPISSISKCLIKRRKIHTFPKINAIMWILCVYIYGFQLKIVQRSFLNNAGVSLYLCSYEPGSSNLICALAMWHCKISCSNINKSCCALSAVSIAKHHNRTKMDYWCHISAVCIVCVTKFNEKTE